MPRVCGSIARSRRHSASSSAADLRGISSIKVLRLRDIDLLEAALSPRKLKLGPAIKLIPKGYEEVIMSARETAELLLQVGRLVQAEGYDGELSPAQWMALRFFARANPFSRTPSAFAEFQSTTRGTATQAIKALEAGGYLVRQPFRTDGRSVSLRLTSKGKKAIARDPFEVLVRAMDSLDATERTAMRRALHQVLSTLVGASKNDAFST